MIELVHVSKRFGRVVAVDDVSCTVREGEAVALWGTNGAGKTTLIRCLLGILRCEGRVSVAGIDAGRDGKRARSLIGYVPQELAFHDDTSLGAAMAFFAQLRCVDARDARRAVRTVDLEGHEAKRLRELSGGMKQRLALAIALLSDPPVVVLDEPTSNLDAAGRRDVVRMLAALKRAGKTLVFASHRPEEVSEVADRVLVLEAGRVTMVTTPDKMWSGAADTRIVRLHVPGGLETAAVSLLREAGHEVELNGRGLCVTTRGDRKGSPIALLTRASIDVHDFELLDARRDTEGAS